MFLGILESPTKMMSQIANVIRESYIRACTTVYARHGAEMEEAVRGEIWTEMMVDMSAWQEITIPKLEKEKPKKEESFPKTADKLDSDDEKEDTKLTPLQRLEKQQRTTSEKINVIRYRQNGKQTPKQKEKDPEDLKKLIAKLAEVEAKITKLTEKAAKKNMEKWTPTWTRHYKNAGGRDDEKTAFQEYVNALSETDFKKSWDVIAKEFVARNAKPEPMEEDEPEEEEEPVKKPVPEDDEDEGVIEVQYDHEDFIVGEKSHKVYRVTEEGDIPVEDLDLISDVIKKFKKMMA